MMTWYEAIVSVLSDNKAPMHYREITKTILELGLVDSLGDTPKNTVSYTLTTNIKKLGVESPFVRVEAGTYALKTNSKDIEFDASLPLTNPHNLNVAIRLVPKPASAKDIATLLSTRMSKSFNTHLERHGDANKALTRLSAEVGTSIDYYIVGLDPRLKTPQSSASYDRNVIRFFEGRKKLYDYIEDVEPSGDEALDNAEEDLAKAEEGYLIDRRMLVRKRDKEIVRQRKQYDDFTCQSCGFRLQVNGTFIVDCHHIDPIHVGKRETDINDLVCLCPTCHRIAHTSNPPITVELIIKYRGT